MVSLRTLCKERPGNDVHGYAELAQVLRKHFWMLMGSGGIRLAPAFDLEPDLSGRSEHSQDFGCPTGKQMLAIGA
jgi:hypothetical protein